MFLLFLSSLPHYQAEYLIFRKWPMAAKLSNSVKCGFHVQESKRSELNKDLMKQLFYSRLLDMRLVIANSALLTSLAIYHLHIQQARME